MLFRSLREIAFVIALWSSCFTAARVARSEEDEWAELVFGWGLSFPLRRRGAERIALSCFFSASLRLCGSWPSLLHRAVPASPRREGSRSEEQEWAELVFGGGLGFPLRR